jgi:hypothetical protein
MALSVIIRRSYFLKENKMGFDQGKENFGERYTYDYILPLRSWKETRVQYKFSGAKSQR